MNRPGLKNISVVIYVLNKPWYPETKLEWSNKFILSVHLSVIVSNAVSFSGVVFNVNNNESNKTYFFCYVSTFLISSIW